MSASVVQSFRKKYGLSTRAVHVLVDEYGAESTPADWARAVAFVDDPANEKAILASPASYPIRLRDLPNCGPVTEKEIIGFLNGCGLLKASL